MVKYKCIKTQCPICGNLGSCQLFLNREGTITYSRVRHYEGKGKFTYHKVEDLEALKTLLKSQDISISNSKAMGQLGQEQTLEKHDPNLKDLSSVSSGRSLVWLGHQPPTQDLTKFKQFLFSKFSLQYAKLQYSYVRKYGSLIENPNEINNLPLSIRSNVMKSLINFSKYLGKYESFKSQLKNYGIKWVSSDNSFNSFLAIINNNHSTLGNWYSKAAKAVNANEKLWLRFTLHTGLRKTEAINSFNLIIHLAREGNIAEYYNAEQGILEHFKYREMFLRNSKNVYVSIVENKLVEEVISSQPVHYNTLRKHLQRYKLALRIKELRSYFATYLRTHGILSEYIDLLQGRIPKSVFAKHYLKIESVKELVQKVNAVIATIESNLVS